MKRSLYREYRPQTFSELIGQDHVARTLHNAVETDAVAHAYVFAGPRGTGKTSTARILAKALNCIGTLTAPVERPTPTPCGVCRHCVAIADGVSLDVVEMDAASNRSIDDVRDLRDKIAFAPVHGRFKVYIIDEVHMLTREAFNALLKTLEEPPTNVVFVLATTEPHKIPETILSRCQRFDFKRPQVRDIVKLLAGIVERENARPDEDRGGPRIEIQDAALAEIARHSQGGFRDAIGTLEKLVTYSEGAIKPADVLEALGVTSSDLLLELTDIIIERSPAEALQFVQRLAHDGVDYSQFIRDLLRHLRQVFLLQHLEDAARDEAALRVLGQTVELDEQRLSRLIPQANNLHPREVVYLIELLGEAQREIRDGLEPRLQLELALVRATRPHLDHTPAALEERLRRLEADAAAGALRPAPGGDRTPAPHASAGASTCPLPDGPDETAIDDRGAREDATPLSDDTPANAASVTPAVPPAPCDAPADVSLERVKRAWDLVLQRVQGSSVSLYAMLREARPTALREAVLTVTLPSNLALARAREPGNVEILETAIEAALGVHFKAVFTPADAAASAANEPGAGTPATPEVYDFTEQIRRAQEKLDAELLPDES